MLFAAGLTSLLLPLIASATPAVELENSTLEKRCTGTISSLDDVATAQTCTTININSFTIPAGEALILKPASGATINLLGTLTFGVSHWDGPLMTISGTSITFNGNGHTLDGQGASYWDGEGLSGGVTKPAPMLRFTNTGTISNFTVLNTPARAISLGNSATSLTVKNVKIDNSAGASKGKNTDCFDISATGGTTVENCTCINQDDCLAINRGSDITFSGNSCSGGHGISVGSVTSDITISGVTITGNTITNSVQALRIKTDASGTGSTVSGITYIGNTASGISDYGIIIDQSYPDTDGTPGTGIILSDVTFSGATSKITVNSGATRVLVNCGSTTSCPGTWEWSSLDVIGGKASSITHATISGGTYL